MLDYAKTRAFDSGEIAQTWERKDTILYALGLGFGSNPVEAGELRYVVEPELIAMPTMAAVLSSPGFWMRDRIDLGIDAMKVVHGEQSLQMHAPLPAHGTVLGRTTVTRVVDKGEGRGAIVCAEKQLRQQATGELLATVQSVYFCRGDGGFSQGAGGDEPPTALEATPDASPDVNVDVPTRPEQALIYRLSGDRNPLHSDPTVAAKLGFSQPILHGLATWGIAARAIVSGFLEHDAQRLKGLRARFSAPVLPGDTLRVECWRRADGAAFRVRALERNTVVLTHGKAVF